MTPGDAPPGDPVDPTRRRLLAAATLGLGAGLGAGALGVVCAALLPASASASPDERGFVDLGAVSDYETGVPVKVAVRGRLRDAYFRLGERVLGSVIVVRMGDQLAVFSATCPHAGCDVEPAGAEIKCPCHDSRFGTDGRVAGGPAPRPLDALETEIADGRVRVRFARYVSGVAEKRAL